MIPSAALTVTGAITVSMQLSFFAIAVYKQFDLVTDFAGSLNFLVLAWAIYLLQGTFYLRQTIATLLTTIWAVRLGSFLLYRVMVRGKDDRFDKIRTDFFKFLGFWIFQMVWSWTVSVPVTLMNATSSDVPLNNLDYAGVSLWVIGFLIETVADQEKYIRNRKSAGSYVKPTGLWAFSRHPNYFGECTAWLGLYLCSITPLQASYVTAGYYVGAASPILTFLLLAFVSGIPLAESRDDKRYCDNAEYKSYKLRTSPLIPFPPSLYSKLPFPVRRMFFLELPIYWKRFRE